VVLLKALSSGSDFPSKVWLADNTEQPLTSDAVALRQLSDNILEKPIEVFLLGLPIEQLNRTPFGVPRDLLG